MKMLDVTFYWGITMLKLQLTLKHRFYTDENFLNILHRQ